MSGDIQYTPGQLAAKYVELRDRKAAIKAKADMDIKPIQELMDAIEEALGVIMNESEATSMRTDHGTIIRSVKTRYDMVDRGVFLDFVRTSGKVELLESRVSQASVKESLDAGEALPAGLMPRSEYAITVRRA